MISAFGKQWGPTREQVSVVEGRLAGTNERKRKKLASSITSMGIQLHVTVKEEVFMSTTDILEKSHTLALQSIEGLPEAEWDVPGVCGDWSVKDILAHLATYEKLLVEVFKTFSGAPPGAYIARCRADQQAFNAAEVEARKYLTAQQVENEYNEGQIQSTALLAKIPAEMLQKTGTLSWYDPNSCLADFLQMIYQHTSEHCSQIALFRERRHV
ncbi:DinB family protein [Ktedonosporobacter rubrisoli]|uniref:DinB family protein n=1 Tax=Ktedonosporobacter rubrisoli TaxID=2509675 RepID=A0A4V0YZ73_KTERU|nr:DinB family protein [Ktedonosporobacter rubrisoli]QBD78721.1 DinB family protein [Ktedonosporobacter rubrisoli]